MRALTALGLLILADLVSGVSRARGREAAPGAAMEPRAISIAGFEFAPAELTVSVGDSVAWINDDAFRHTTTADSGAWASAELTRGQRFVFVPRRPGRFPYHCTAHPVMRAVIHVRE